MSNFGTGIERQLKEERDAALTHLDLALRELRRKKQEVEAFRTEMVRKLATTEQERDRLAADKAEYKHRWESERAGRLYGQRLTSEGHLAIAEIINEPGGFLAGQEVRDELVRIRTLVAKLCITHDLSPMPPVNSIQDLEELIVRVVLRQDDLR